MLKTSLGVVLAALLFTSGAFADDPPADTTEVTDTIIAVDTTTKKTAAQCETAVVAECKATTCPAFCGALDDPKACKASCETTRCKIRLFGAQDQADNLALDSQNREQFLACVNENQEPGARDRVPAPTKARKSKKHTSGWKKRETGSFKVRKASKKKKAKS